MTKKKSFYDTLYDGACTEGQTKLRQMKARGATLESAWNLISKGQSSVSPDYSSYVVLQVMLYTGGKLPKEAKNSNKAAHMEYDVRDYENPFVGNKLKTEIEQVPPRKNKTEELSVKEQLKKYIEKPSLDGIEGHQVYIAAVINNVYDDTITLSIGESGVVEIELSAEELYEIIK